MCVTVLSVPNSSVEILHGHRVIIYFIEAKMTSHHTYCGHLSVEYLPLLCMAAAATKSRGVKIYHIFAQKHFFLVKMYVIPHFTVHI
jgi:hypothetical protein